MKQISLIFAISILSIFPLNLSGQKSVYTFPFENSYRLPSMRTEINTDEISASYQTMGNIYTTEITGLGEDKMEQTSMSYISDAKVVDAVRFLELYMDEQLVARGDESAGMVEMSIIYYHEHARINAGSIVVALTFGMGALLGIPYSTMLVDVETEAAFYNNQNVLMATHRGVGRGRKIQSLYSTSTRKAHQRAILHSLESLNSTIMEDPQLTGLN